MQIKTVALLGAGAVGAYFIWGLSEMMGDDFCVVANGERKERLKRDGLVINGQTYKLNVKEATEVKNVDLLLVASKQDGLEGALEDIRCMAGEKTIVMSLLNGVKSEEIIGNVIGMEHMLYSVMRIASVRKGNEITFIPEITAGVFVGEKDCKEPTERVFAIQELFEKAGLHHHFMELTI